MTAFDVEFEASELKHNVFIPKGCSGGLFPPLY